MNPAPYAAGHGERLKLFLAAYTPEKTTADIGREIGACAGYVRATAKRQGLLLANSNPKTNRIERLLTALHDAIRRPMGVVPDSAVEFYDAKRADMK
jgi:hypothetical protein